MQTSIAMAFGAAVGKSETATPTLQAAEHSWTPAAIQLVQLTGETERERAG